MDEPLVRAVTHPLVAPAVAGIFTHLICHYRHPASLKAFAAVVLLPPVIVTILLSSPFSVLFLLRSIVIYLVSLSLSVTAYRLSPFHPLAKYPGPILARISRFWAISEVIGENQHIDSHKLFDRYGDVVRTGPNHLIIRNASAIPVIHGPKDRWPRHARYDMMRRPDSHGSLLGLIDPVAHSKRRRVWDRAFTPTAIKSYDPMLHARLSQLITNLNSRTGQPIDLAEWFGFFSLDFMGDFAYGGMFDFMARGEDTEGFHDFGMKALGIAEIFGTVPWIGPFVKALPSKPRAFQEMALRVVEKRTSGGSQVRDLFHYLLNEDGDGNYQALNKPTLAQEASLAIIAGSDTTATALANAIYYLICQPEIFKRLRAELDTAAGEGTAYDVPIEGDRLTELKYLQAVFNETVRLQPAVPNGIQRTTPQESGVFPVAGYAIPGGTNVQIPTWSIHRDPRYFSPVPEEFWPERWLPEEASKIAEARGQEYRLAQGAYMPFHYGPANCVGRSLALHEARTVLAAVVRRFDFAFAPGFGSQDWLDQLKDQYILVRGKLRVVVTPRK